MIVKVIVDIPSAQVNRPFDYAVPEALQDFVQLGMRVQVPFGPRKLLGFVVGIERTTAFVGKLKLISTIMDYETFLNEELLALSEYLSEQLQVFRITVLQAMLPAMLKVKYHNVFIVQDETAFQMHVPTLDLSGGQIFDKDILEQHLSKAQLKRLLDKGILTLEYRIEDQATVKTVTYVKATQSLDDIISSLGKRGPKLKQLLQFMQQYVEVPFTYKALSEQAGVSVAVIKSAIEKGYLFKYEQQEYRNPFEGNEFTVTQARSLTHQQQIAYDRIAHAVNYDEVRTFLLEGVTGSGKTEIYLQLMAQARAKGQSAILLVPEISLTPQMVNQVKGRFQNGVAVLHSGLSTSEKYDEWRRIVRGEATIVVGARSSIFAPLKKIGIIIIDEEHETTYKQADAPRYHARDVAMWRSQYHSCPLVLGSATPSLESRSRAEVGKYEFIQLKERVNQSDLPPVQIIDMTQTHDELSIDLQRAISSRLERHEQVVLLLNRRGYASYMLCRECGYVFQCPRCDISLTYHKHENRLKCHYCDYHMPVPAQCPQCQSEYLRNRGSGTQKVAEIIERLFPNARLLRMDVDTTRRKGEHERLLKQFANHEADILLGTQMIAKGLDFEKVTLVGVINADTALNLPDFRASEKTFQLLTQVAGRTGRGRFKGEVMIQTYNPDHYVIQLAQRHDYESFFYYEMKRRHMGNYPPYYYTTLLTVSSKQQSAAYQKVYELKAELFDVELDQSGQLLILGPSRGAIAKVNDVYYFQLLLKYKDRKVIQQRLRDLLEESQQTSRQGVYIAIDHEPLYFV